MKHIFFVGKLISEMNSNGIQPVSAFEMYKKNGQNKKQRVPLKKSPKKPKKEKKQETESRAKKPKKRPNRLSSAIPPNGSPKRKKKNVQIKEENDDEVPMLIEVQPTRKSKKNTLHDETKIIKELPKLKNNSRTASCSNEVVEEKEDDNCTTEGLTVFKWLIADMDPSDFFENYWEKETMYLKRQQSWYYEHIFSSSTLDNILRQYPLHYTRNVDVVSYENGVKEVFNQEGRAVPAALWDYYSNGCSIRVLNPQTYSKKVHLIIAALQEYFGTMVGTNVYLTPPGTQGFAPHYDDIEAFVIQLEGRKHWKLYWPKGPDVLARDSSPNLRHEDIGKPFMEVTLNAGDLLYFPRGTIHEGRTDAEAHSLHITLSVYQHTAYADLLEHILPTALKKAATNDISFREGLPLDYLKHVGYVNKNIESDERKSIMNKVKELMNSLTDYVDVDQAADQLGRKFMHDSMPPVLHKSEVNLTSKTDGDYMKNGKVFNRVEFGLDTMVRLLRYHSIRLVMEVGSPQAKIYYCTDNANVYHGEEEQWLEIDETLIPAVKMLHNCYPVYVQVESLPIEDVTSKICLVTDLWEKGLLVTRNPLISFDENSDDEQGSDCDEIDNVTV